VQILVLVALICDGVRGEWLSSEFMFLDVIWDYSHCDSVICLIFIEKKTR